MVGRMKQLPEEVDFECQDTTAMILNLLSLHLHCQEKENVSLGALLLPDIK